MFAHHHHPSPLHNPHRITVPGIAAAGRQQPAGGLLQTPLRAMASPAPGALPSERRGVAHPAGGAWGLLTGQNTAHHQPIAARGLLMALLLWCLLAWAGAPQAAPLTPLPGTMAGYIYFVGDCPQGCDLPWGGSVPSGEGVIAYQSATSNACEAQSEIRQCYNGVLSGSFSQARCDPLQVTEASPQVTAVIDLGGNLGQLIHPVTVDGGKTYYVLDRNKDGIHDSQDWIDFNELRTLFFAGAFITESNSTTTTANGVRLRLPSIGESPVIRGRRPVTSVAGAEINPTYDGLLAIWDAFNGRAPLGWSTDNNYYSATSTFVRGTSGYEVMNFMHGEYYNSLVANRRYIAFEVF